MFMSSLSGFDNYTEYEFEGDDPVLLHEFAASYQFNSRANIRYFANWTENTTLATVNIVWNITTSSNGNHLILLSNKPH